MPETDPVLYPHLYRGISKKRWYISAEQKVLSAAFKLRPGEAGLSVLKRDGCSVGVCLAERNECYGEFSVETQNVLAMGLDVIEDEPDDPNHSDIHAEIRGLPPFEDELKAEDVATELSELASLHYDRLGKF